MNRRLQSERGTVILVALCFVAVLGISLAAYLALCSRTMQLSNRTAQTSLSQQLAEIGLEEALRAFNKNDWSGWPTNPAATDTIVDWTVSGTTATCIITFPAGKFGQGVTGTVKIRVDNYNAAQLDSIWASGVNYRIGDLMGDNGLWYRCIKAHTSSSSSQPVNWNYWVPEGIPWSWNSTTPYSAEDLIVYNEVWYRCKSANTNKPPLTNPTNWQSLVGVYTTSPAWPYVPSSGQEALLINGGAFTRLTFQNSTWGYNYNWRWQSVSYSVGDIVYYNGLWYSCMVAHTNNGNWTYNVTNTGAGYWKQIESLSAWNSLLNYNLTDVVYHSATSKWYRCIKANSGQSPSSTSSYWSSSPLRSNAWESGKSYTAAATVIHNGVWYRSLTGTNNYNRNPTTETTYWSSAANSPWDSSVSYTANTSYVSCGGVWYLCKISNTGKTPNNSTYWTALGAPVIYAEGAVNIAGNPSINTQLRASLAPAPLFPNAIAATNGLTISSGTGTVDSYDNGLGTSYAAQTGNHSTNYSAVLAAGSTLAINGTTAVNGYLAWPSPPSGISSGTTVYGPSSPASPKVDPTRVSRSPFVPDFGIQSFLGSSTLSLGNSAYTLGIPGAVTPLVYSINSSSNSPNLVLNSTAETITIVGPVILYISGNLQVTSGKIIIASTGSAEIHFSGRLRIQNNTSGGIQNLTSDPRKLTLIGTSTATNHIFQSTTFDYYGTIYIPDGTLTIDSGVEIYGALSAKNITFSSEAKLHYDTSLRYTVIPGVDQPYAITEWRELTDSTERVTMP